MGVPVKKLFLVLPLCFIKMNICGYNAHSTQNLISQQQPALQPHINQNRQPHHNNAPQENQLAHRGQRRMPALLHLAIAERPERQL